MTKNGIMDNNVKHTESKIDSLTRTGSKRQTDPERYMRNRINMQPGAMMKPLIELESNK
jgi:hypothetical protein